MNKLTKQELLKKAKSLPSKPGCYLMKNNQEEVIYVGKAKKLKSRVVSYFNESTKSPKTQMLVSHIRNFDFIMTDSDPESFVLENNLIKEHRPKYNIRMRDDKSYPYVGIKLDEAFAKIDFIRRPKKDKKRKYYGPFPVGFNVSRIIRLVTKAFRLRDCSKHEFNNRKTPCILHQMNQCSAPCVNLIDEKNYKKDLQLALNFFQDTTKANKSLKLLQKKMQTYAENEDFEKAAGLRDLIFELEDFINQLVSQRVESLEENNMDVMAYYRGEHEVDISLYQIRSGNLLGHKNFHFSTADYWDDLDDEVMQYLLQFYSQYDEMLPETLVVEFEKQKRDLFEEALTRINNGKKVKVLAGTSGVYKPLLQTTKDHAKESGRVRSENEDSVYIGLNHLQELLNLKERPQILECYDIAIWQGKSPTASQIVFDEGKADKTRYRYYHLEERPEGNNDFAMMREVFERRLKRGRLPDVFIVDGGKGQVSTVKAVLGELGVDVPLIGIAKSKDIGGVYEHRTQNKSEERLIIPGRSNPYILKKSPSLFKIIVQMRDEAHRFSRKLHHKTEHKRILKSWVDDIKGINDETRKLILQNSSAGVEELKNLNVSELKDLLGINQRAAKILFQFLRQSLS
jgi:excinuclease ABC subunit C